MPSYNQLQQKNKELSILNNIAQQLNKEVRLAKALPLVLAQIVDLLDLKTGWIWLFDPQKKESQLAASFNLPPIFKEKPALLSGECYCIQQYLSQQDDQQALNISEITCTRLKNLQEGTAGLRYHASVPLRSGLGSQNMGILNVVSERSQRLSSERLQLLYTIGDLIGIAINRSRLFENSLEMGVIEERNRLAREIHDTLAQGLTAISLQLETLDILLEQEQTNERIQKVVEQLKKLAQQNIKAARRSVVNLRATPLTNKNVVEALVELAADWQAKYGLQVELKVEGAVKEIEKRLEMGIYRIVQEALQNVWKHAQTDKVWVKFRVLATAIELDIIDKGKGFDPSILDGKGWGLIGIRERVNLLDGQFELRSEIQKGTSIQIVFPKFIQ